MIITYFCSFQNSVSFSQIFAGLSSMARRDSSGDADDLDADQRLDSEDALRRQDFHNYLKDARQNVRSCYEATRCWRLDYDGLNPPPSAIDEAVMSDANAGRVPAALFGEERVGEAEEAREALCAGEEDDDFAVTAPSSGYTSLAAAPAACPDSTLPAAEAEEDQEFWSLMRDPSVPEARLNRAIRRMQQLDEVASGASSLASSSECSPREYLRQQQQQQPRRTSHLAAARREDDVDLTVNSLGKLFFQSGLICN